MNSNKMLFKMITNNHLAVQYFQAVIITVTKFHCAHFAPGSYGGSFPHIYSLVFHLNYVFVAPGIFLSTGNSYMDIYCSPCIN